MTSPHFLQDEREFAAWCDVLKAEGVTSYLEIGAKFGGSLSRAAESLPIGSRLVAVDLPRGTRLWRETEPALEAAIATLKAKGYDPHLIWGDSTAKDVIERVRLLAPFDACFIDANHTRAFLEQDWANYGPFARIVAFHDISWQRPADWVGIRIDAREFWDELKVGYRHQEFKFHQPEKDNGIGVLWRS